MEILNSQKQQLFAIIKNSGISPSQFAWGEMAHPSGIGTVPALLVKGAGYFFAFLQAHGRSYVSFSPGSESPTETGTVVGWDDRQHFFQRWLIYLQRELQATDPWDKLEQQTVSYDLKLDDETPERPFSVAEHRQVKQTLSVIQGLLITYAIEISMKQDVIISGIKRLESAAEDQDRKSWFHLVVGYIISTATAMGLDGEKTKALFTALKKGLDGTILFLSNHP